MSGTAHALVQQELERQNEQKRQEQKAKEAEAAKQAAKVARLQSEADKGAKKEQAKAERERKKREAQAQREEERQMEVRRAIFDCGMFGAVDGEGYAELSWQAFWHNKVEVPTREREPQSYTDYAPEVVSEARRLLQEGFSEDTDVCLAEAQLRASRRWNQQDAVVMQNLQKVLDLELVRKEGIPHTIGVHFVLADADPKSGSVQSEHPIVLLALCGRVDMLKVLLPVSLRATQTEALIHAAQHGKHNVIKLLLTHGAARLEARSAGYALVQAVANEKVEAVREILAVCAVTTLEHGSTSGGNSGEAAKSAKNLQDSTAPGSLPSVVDGLEAARANDELAWAAERNESGAPVDLELRADLPMSHNLAGTCHAPWFESKERHFGVVELAMKKAIESKQRTMLELLLESCELNGGREAMRLVQLALHMRRQNDAIALMRQNPSILSRLDAEMQGGSAALRSHTMHVAEGVPDPKVLKAAALRSLRFTLWHVLEEISALPPSRPWLCELPFVDVGLTQKEALGLQPSDPELCRDFNISRQELRVVKALFALADTDNSGYLDREELAVAMEEMLLAEERHAVAQLDSDGDEIDALFRSMDVNQDNQIDLAEFVRWWTQAAGTDGADKFNKWWIQDAVRRSFKKKSAAMAALKTKVNDDDAEEEKSSDSDSESESASGSESDAEYL